MFHPFLLSPVPCLVPSPVRVVVSAPLVDVDLNLFSSDLLSSYAGQTPMSVLLHPSTQALNLSACLVPAATLKETEDAVAFIKDYESERRERAAAAAAGDSESSSSSSSSFSSASSPPSFPVLPELKTTVGIHPYNVGVVVPTAFELSDLANRLSSLLTSHYPSTIAAVGECGLDYSPHFPPSSVQLPYFARQVRSALRFRVPLFLHERNAHVDFIQILKEELLRDESNSGWLEEGDPLPVPILVHCFTGSLAECATYVKLGCHLSFSGHVNKNGRVATKVVTKEVGGGVEQGEQGRSDDSLSADTGCSHSSATTDPRTILGSKAVPLTRLMVETDAPYMGFKDCRSSLVLADVAKKDGGLKLNSKELKKAKEKVFPNVAGSLEKVLSAVLEAINSSVPEGQDKLSRDQLADITTANANNFFGFAAAKKSKAANEAEI